MSEVILERPSDGVTLLRLNRPAQRNALSTALRELVARHINELAIDDSVRCIVITGNEKSFASGGDITELNSRTPVDVAYNSSKEPWRALMNCPKPVIGALQGFALGGGSELALNCDILVVGRGAKLGQPEIKIGISPGSGGVQRVLRVIGKYRAMRWLLTGDILSGEKAYELGLASEVVDDALVVDRAIEIGKAIAALPPMAEIYLKESVLAGLNGSLPTGLMLENNAARLLFATEDAAEGIAAFLERRQPDFTGR